MTLTWAPRASWFCPDSVGSATHQHLVPRYWQDCHSLPARSESVLGKFNSVNNQDVQEVIPVLLPTPPQLDGGIYGLPAYWKRKHLCHGTELPIEPVRDCEWRHGYNHNLPFSTKHVSRPSRRDTWRSPPAGRNQTVIVWILDFERLAVERVPAISGRLRCDPTVANLAL